MQTIKAHIEGFGNPEFVAIMMKNIDSGQDLHRALCVNRGGINNGEFIHRACVERERFLRVFPYSRENLEKFFQVRFCEVRRCRVNNRASLTFTNGAKWGQDVVYIHERQDIIYYTRIEKNEFM